MKNNNSIESGWNFVAGNISSSFGSQVGETYTDSVAQAIKQLSNDMNGKSGTSESIDTLKGFIAEYWHADTFNIDATLKGSMNRCTILRSNEAASVDVATTFNDGYSMKYYATGAESAKQQATNVIQAYHKYLSKSHADVPMTFEEYLKKNNYSSKSQDLYMSIYNGQGRVIPTDQLQDAIKQLNKMIETESSKGGSNRLALLIGYKETLQKLTDRISDGKGVESIPLTKEEAETIAALCKDGKFKPEDFGFSLNELITSEYILQQALKSGYTAAVISLVLQLAPEIYKAIDYLIKNGKIDIEQLKRTGIKALTSSSEGFLKGSVSAALTIACKAGKLGSAFIDVPAGVIAAITLITIDTIKDSILVGCGKIDARTMANNLTKELIVSGASIAFGTIGQTILPELPVLGYMLGSFVGSIVASISLSLSEKTILSFCANTGFSFFGLVDQNYELPKEIIDILGIDVVEIEYSKIDEVEKNTVEIDFVEIDEAEYESVDFTILRRGVIGVNKIGYIY